MSRNTLALSKTTSQTITSLQIVYVACLFATRGVPQVLDSDRNYLWEALACLSKALAEKAAANHLTIPHPDPHKPHTYIKRASGEYKLSQTGVYRTRQHPIEFNHSTRVLVFSPVYFRLHLTAIASNYSTDANLNKF